MNQTKYRIGSLSSSEPKATSFMIEHKLLSSSWYKEMRDKTSIIWLLQDLDLAWRCCHENFASLNKYVESHKKQLSVSTELHLLTDEVQDSFVKLSQLITNCVVSYTACVNMCEQHMKRVHSKNSESFKQWNTSRQQLHEDTFEYRFGYDLRNYTQHYGLPLSEVVLSMDSESLKGLNVFVNKSSLLKGSFEWRSEMRAELKSLTVENIDVIEVSVKYLKCVDDVYKGVLDSHIEELSRCDSYLDDLFEIFKIEQHENPVVFKGDIPTGSQVPREKEFIPVYLLKRMKMVWGERLSFNITKH
ncbi:hypothetical protein [Vibrio sp. ED002]|uniref:hypothetical protein n=1 Tax=Vibrio sp. ED002 TaxID=2785123 RepID=UPI00200BB64A|nr:hypothetical protein [Vibrio sp. ED002]UQA51017.1 hypothetical protein ITG12_01400 [Vibrio sp. ED002]